MLQPLNSSSKAERTWMTFKKKTHIVTSQHYQANLFKNKFLWRHNIIKPISLYVLMTSQWHQAKIFTFLFRFRKMEKRDMFNRSLKYTATLNNIMFLHSVFKLFHSTFHHWLSKHMCVYVKTTISPNLMISRWNWISLLHHGVDLQLSMLYLRTSAYFCVIRNTQKNKQSFKTSASNFPLLPPILWMACKMRKVNN